MNIIEATKKATELNKGIVIRNFKEGKAYYIPTNTREGYLLVLDVDEDIYIARKWNIALHDMLREDWEVME